ncbi:MAG: tRNA (guanosine(37)-N1)-methyltransferase TrmD [Bacteroidales bacterium]|nr:tRNA (guanosine(37)-N1)-methyltransferase TrmD [Bacteroidales bacterium]
MRIDILTLFPIMFEGVFSQSIIKRAVNKGILELHTHDIRDYSKDKHKRVDDYPFGGGPGMVMMVEPIADCITALKSERNYDAVLFMAPDGQTFNQSTANRISLYENVIILCGHYKGVDERVRQLFVTEEISIGDYVLSGGEIAAMTIVDAVARLLPGVLGDETSALSDSFQDGLLSPPVYTRPADYQGHKVPDILLSGNERLINDWKLEQQLARTKARRPDLYAQGGFEE